MAVYESLEYLLCYNEEKREQRRIMLRQLRDQRRADTNPAIENLEHAGESTRLLTAEEIQMESFSSNGSVPSRSQHRPQDRLQSGNHTNSTSSSSSQLLSSPHIHNVTIASETSGNFNPAFEGATSQDYHTELSNSAATTGVPQDILNTLSPEEMKLNMNLYNTDSSDDILLFDAKKS